MKKKSGFSFDKFKKKKNSAIKEEFKQQKRQWRKEKQEFFEKKKAEERSIRYGSQVPVMKTEGRGVKIEKTPNDRPKTITTKTTSKHKQQTSNRNHLPSAAATHERKIGVEEMPLNKFIAHSGVCARRDAAILVKEGKIKVNGTVILEPGFKVTTKDKVFYNNKQIHLSKNLVYILMNKPKDYITTASDPEGRKTIFDLIANATDERVYPVGRLDRNTTGVLLLTNDGELAQRLSHPKFNVKKIYEVKLDKDITKKELDKIAMGITLEDGFVKPDAVAYADTKDKSVVGIQIHSGRNRIVRRIFEHMGYDVKSLDRVMFANLTKKNVDRGKWRFLSEKEIRLLKHFTPNKK
jgi:23S rRNA pseudouridine2605 synthase